MIKYTSFNKRWCDDIEIALKKIGAITSRSTETVYKVTKDNETLSINRDGLPDYELGKVRKSVTLYIVESDRELK